MLCIAVMSPSLIFFLFGVVGVSVMVQMHCNILDEIQWDLNLTPRVNLFINLKEELGQGDDHFERLRNFQGQKFEPS